MVYNNDQLKLAQPLKLTPASLKLAQPLKLTPVGK